MIGSLPSRALKLVLIQRIKKATDALVDSSKAPRDLQGVKVKNQSRRKSVSKQQAIKSQVTKRSKTYEFFEEKGVSSQKFFSPVQHSLNSLLTVYPPAEHGKPPLTLRSLSSRPARLFCCTALGDRYLFRDWDSICEAAQVYLMVVANSVVFSLFDNIVLRSVQKKRLDVSGTYSSASGGSVPTIPRDSVPDGLSHSAFGSTRLQ